jgi:putative membrane protein
MSNPNEGAIMNNLLLERNCSMRRYSSIFAVAIAVLVTGTAFAERLSPADKLFVMKSLQGNEAEVKMGRLGLRKSRNPEVRKTAQHLLNDHAEANRALVKVAGQVGVATPKQINPGQKAAYRSLSSLNGKAFDQAFVKAGLMAHKKDIQAYAAEVENGKNETVRDYAATYLPRLQDHKTMLQDIQRSH